MIITHLTQVTSALSLALFDVHSSGAQLLSIVDYPLTQYFGLYRTRSVHSPTNIAYYIYILFSDSINVLSALCRQYLSDYEYQCYTTSHQLHTPSLSLTGG